MSNYEHITQELLEEIKTVIADAAIHKYSVSKIYKVYNQVFKLSEKPESCASCLRNRANALKRWFNDYLNNLDKGVTRIDMVEGQPIDFIPNKDNAEKGKVKYADGTGVKAGTYVTASGDEIAVQLGGKATIKKGLL